jgi:peptidoglycan/LPS O-acetylase OafA/YrhL
MALMNPQGRSLGHIPSLDGIRGVAFLIVFVSHGGLAHLVPGGFGVSVFFFLSGYLITTLMRLEADRTGTVSLPNFFIRRIVRIFPPFYLLIAIALIFHGIGLLGGRLDRAALVAQVFHLSNYYLIVSGPTRVIAGTVVLWSLAVEEHFYLVFPLFYCGLRRYSQKTQVSLLVAACFLILLWRIVLICLLGASSDRIAIATDTRIDSILFGCILAVAGNPVMDPEPRWRRLLFPSTLLAIGILLFTFLYRNDAFRDTYRYTLQGIALFPCFTFAIQSRGMTFNALNWGPLQYMGRISYTLYLVHACALDITARLIPKSPVLSACLALTGAFLFAVLVHHSIEKPLHRLRSRITSQRQGGQQLVYPERAAVTFRA